MITKLRRSRVHEFPLDISFRHFLANTIPSSFTSPVIFLLVAAIVPHNYFNLIFCLLMCWETVCHNCVLQEENSKQMKYFEPTALHDQHLT